MRDHFRVIFHDIIHSDMLDNKTIRDFGGRYRKPYRILIINFYCSAFMSNIEGFNFSTQYLSEFYQALKRKELKKIRPEFLSYIEESIPEFMKLELRVDIKSDPLILKALEFFRDYRKDYIEQKKSLFLYKDLAEFWKIEDFYKERFNVMAHHWIELQPFVYTKPVLTFPEYFAYQDMINIWNQAIEKTEKLYELEKGYPSPTDIEYRTTKYTLSTLMRNSIISGVHFVESYLYYLYYNLREKRIFEENTLLNRRDIRKINDKEIIRDLIYKEYPNSEESLEKLFDKYLVVLEDRDAFTHISAFSEDNKYMSRMQRLININLSSVKESLENNIEFVLAIESIIGEERILFWWDYVEYPIFENRRNISPLMLNK